MSEAEAITLNRKERRAGAVIARKTDKQKQQTESSFKYLFGLMENAAVKLLPHHRAATVQSVVQALHKLAGVASFNGVYPSFTIWTLCKRFRGLGNGDKAKEKYKGEPHRAATRDICLALEGLGFIKLGGEFWQSGNPETRGSMGRSVMFLWDKVKAEAEVMGLTNALTPREGMTKCAKWAREKAAFARAHVAEAKAKALIAFKNSIRTNRARIDEATQGTAAPAGVLDPSSTKAGEQAQRQVDLYLLRAEQLKDAKKKRAEALRATLDKPKPRAAASAAAYEPGSLRDMFPWMRRPGPA